MPAEQSKKRWMPSAESLLSRGEIGILQMIADGRTDREIADELAVSKKLVGQYRDALCAKTGARNRVQLARYAVAARLVPLEWRPDLTKKPRVVPEV